MTDASIVTACEHTSHGIFNFSSKPTGAWAHYAEPTKKCGNCGETKSVVGFNKHAKKKDGLQTQCKTCAAVYHEANKAKSHAKMAEYRASNKARLEATPSTIKAQICATCSATKPISDFAPSLSNLSGWKSSCKPCEKQKATVRALQHQNRLASNPITCERKHCAKCQTTKSIQDFAAAKNTHDGLKPNCKTCVARVIAQWEDKNSVRRTARAAEYYRLNKQAYRLRGKQWAESNPMARKALSSKYYNANKDKVNLSARLWRHANPEKARETWLRWAKLHPESSKIKNHNRRARIKHNGGKLTRGITAKLLKLQNGKCACCHADLSETQHHLDHIMPLALGGANQDWNMQLLCPPCNLSKNAKHPVDFMQSRGFLL